MSKYSSKLSLVIVLILGTILFSIFGRSIYMPIINKIKGNQTVEDVNTALQHKVDYRVLQDLKKLGIQDFPDRLSIVGLKEERVLQVYAHTTHGNKLIKQYPFTGYSGQLGPKLKEGDKQIPEGVYHIEYLNPNSAYHLSLKVSYPNDFDVSKSKFEKQSMMGNDIFIHGKSSTIGCIPIGDKAVEELFLLANHAIKNQIKVIISPRDFRRNSQFPEIKAIDWEDELYMGIKTELQQYPLN